MSSASSKDSGIGSEPKIKKRLSETSLRATPIYLPSAGGVLVATSTNGLPGSAVPAATPISVPVPVPVPSKGEPKLSTKLPPIDENNGITER